eukprot:3391140-Amphidinium_carterae.1
MESERDCLGSQLELLELRTEQTEEEKTFHPVRKYHGTPLHPLIQQLRQPYIPIPGYEPNAVGNTASAARMQQAQILNSQPNTSATPRDDMEEGLQTVRRSSVADCSCLDMHSNQLTATQRRFLALRSVSPTSVTSREDLLRQEL